MGRPPWAVALRCRGAVPWYSYKGVLELGLRKVFDQMRSDFSTVSRRQNEQKWMSPCYSSFKTVLRNGSLELLSDAHVSGPAVT